MRLQDLKCALLLDPDTGDLLATRVIAAAKWVREDGTPWGVKGEAIHASKAIAIEEAMANMVQNILEQVT